MEAYIRSLETEIGAREKLLCLLREALLFYEKQRGEAKIVVYVKISIFSFVEETVNFLIPRPIAVSERGSRNSNRLLKNC